MKNKKSLLKIAFLSLIMFGCSSTNTVNDDMAIDNTRIAFNEAFNTRNLQSMAALIDSDAIWLIPGHPVVVGKESVLAAYKYSFENDHRSMEVKPGDLKVSGDWAILTTEFNTSDTLSIDSISTVEWYTGHNILAFKKQVDGSWKIARDIWNESAL